MASLGCNNANYCLRAFGKFYGKDGWFSTCASDDACQSYPNCTTVKTGSNDYATSYTSCCCNTALCNDLAFTGGKKDTTGSAKNTRIYSIFFYFFPLLSFFVMP
uniref:UPAR/Ly6 domain-containing protein n=1 Tax=Panagrolaimus superbus TaxID=310955 RepID=A0A914YMA6_9BILA